MPDVLLTRVVTTAQVLARDLGDVTLLERLAELRGRSDQERTEDCHQLLWEFAVIVQALSRMKPVAE